MRDHREAERLRLRRHRARDIAEADQAEHLPFQAPEWLKWRQLPAAGLHQLVGERNLACERQEQRQGVVGDFAQAIVRHVSHGDAARRRRRHVDIVDPEPGTPDHLAAVEPGDDGGSDLRIADDDRVGVMRDGDDVVHRGALRHADVGVEPGLRQRFPDRIERRKWTVGDGDDRAGHGASTSGLTMFGGRWPSSTAMMLSTTMFAISSRTSTVALPRCGTITTFFMRLSSGCTLGSCSNTSSPAPAIFLALSARTSAASSTIAPRAVLMRNAVFFIKPSSRAPIWWRVVALSGWCSDTKSDSCRS